jgi:hypothetical protein
MNGHNETINAAPNDVERLSTWLDCASAIDALIARASKMIDLVDHDLRLQGWDTQARAEALRVAMHVRGVQVRMLLAEQRHIAAEFPRLFNLLKTHGHRLAIVTPNKRIQPVEFMAVADGQHSIFRPISVQSTGFAYIENRSKSVTYSTNFKVIWEQGGRRLFPESFGL